MCNVTDPERPGEVALHQLLRKTGYLQGLMREYIGSLLEISKGNISYSLSPQIVKHS